MTVENQFPYQSFTANGLQTNFALGFYVDDKDHFEVSKNDQAVSKNDYSYDKGSNSIFFNTPPKTGEQIEVTRRTASERGITYSTYNNTFRPETLNKDLDRIWLKLQELGVVDQLQKLYTQTLHNQQQQYIEQKDEILQSNINALEAYTKSEVSKLETNINNVKNYSDTQNATLKNELLRIFAEHDVHFNSLDSLTSYILNRLSLLETSSIVGAKLFGSVAEGLANTKKGEYFNVITSDSETYAELYKNENGTAVSQSKSLQSYNGSRLEFTSIAALRSFNPRRDGDTAYLVGLTTGSIAGAGLWYYDSNDKTSKDNGWFIVKTTSGKILKRVDLDKEIKLDWAGISVKGDLAIKWQEAINYAESVRVAKGTAFDIPLITIPKGKYTMSTGVVHPNYISTEFEGSTSVEVSYYRSQCPYVVAMRNASGTQTIYRNELEGVRWNHALTARTGKVKFAYVVPVGATVIGSERPSCITTGNLQGTTYAYQCNMRVTNVEAYGFRAAHEVLGINSWGYRFENCGFGGSRKTTDEESTYSIWTSSTANSDSGERNTYVNCFMSALRFDTPSLYTYFDHCSFDFSGEVVLTINSTAVYNDIRFTACHIEHFEQYVIESALSTSGATNTFITISGGRILSTAWNRANTHDIILFKGNCKILLSDGLVLENSGYPSSNSLGENLGTGGTEIRTKNVYTKDGRPRINSSTTLLSVGNDFVSDNVDTVISTTVPTTNYTVLTMQQTDNKIAISSETNSKILEISAKANNAYIKVLNNSFTRIQPHKRYISRPVLEIADEQTTAVVRPLIYWYDENKSLISVSNPNYDLTLTQYINGSGVTFNSRETKRIPIVHIDFKAPIGAAYAKQGFEIANMKELKTYSLHKIELHSSLSN